MFKIENLMLTLLVIVCFLVTAVVVSTVIGPELRVEGLYSELVNSPPDNRQQENGLEGWEVYRNEGFGFEIQYPKTFLQKSAVDQNTLNSGVGVSAGTPVWQFRLDDPGLYQNTNLVEASLVIHVDHDQGSPTRCSEYLPGDAENSSQDDPEIVEINGIPFWKDTVQEGVMGGTYYTISYKTISQGACYELTQVVQSLNPESYLSDSVSPFDKDAVLEKLDQVLQTFKFLDVTATFPPQSYPDLSSQEEVISKDFTPYVDGIDVSHWQGDIGWLRAAASGISFAFVKASEGNAYTDFMLHNNMAEGENAGVYLGVYHFARPDLGNTGAEEAEYFLSVAGDYLKSGYLRPVLDLEVGDSLGRTALSNWVLEWMQTVENQTGIAPLIYTNLYYINNYLTDAVTEYDLWMAYWTCDPSPGFNMPPTGRWGDWAFWQYCVSPPGTVPGINTSIDQDIFNGVEASLIEYDAASPLWVDLINPTRSEPAPYPAEFTANVHGDAVGPIDYWFWWDCSSLEVDIDSVRASCGALPDPAEVTAGECYENEFGLYCYSLSEDSKIAAHTYPNLGDYTAKVIVKRGEGNFAEDRYRISISDPVISITPDPDSPQEAIRNQTFPLSIDVEFHTSVSGVLQAEIVDDITEDILADSCLPVAGEVQATETFDLSFVESETGIKNYSIWVRYRPGEDCPIMDQSADDKSAPYLINWGSTPTISTNFDGDGESDPAKFYPSTGTVWWLESSTDSWESAWLGSGSFDYVRYSDFDGDGRTDPAKFSSADGTVWYIQSSTGSWDGAYLGNDSYTVMVGSDFDGDGKTDPTKLLPSGAIWYLNSSTGTWEDFWVGSEDFVYVAGSDFDGDGMSDPAKFIADPGVLWYWESGTSGWVGVYLGSDVYDYVSASDFDGDGKTDPAKYYPSTGTVWWLQSSTGTWDAAWLGAGSITFVGGNDFDGDGITDPAKYDPAVGTLSWLKSSTGTWDSADLGTDSYELVN